MRTGPTSRKMMAQSKNVRNKTVKPRSPQATDYMRVHGNSTQEAKRKETMK